MAQLYGLSADDVAKIRQLLARVEAMERSGAPRQAAEFQGGMPVTVYVGTQNGTAWAKNATGEVLTWAGWLTAKNYFANLSAKTGTRNCMIVWSGYEWVLAAAECS